MQSLSALRLHAPPASRPPVLLYSDIDDSTVGWESYNRGPDEVGLERSAEVLRRNRDRMVSGLSTSRGLTEIRRLAPLMRRFPLDYLGANNGQQLFVNSEHLPADRWLLSLTDADADPAWSREVKRTSGWELPRVLGAIEEQLRADGFRPAPRMEPPLETLVNFEKTVDGASILFSYYPDQPSFAIRSGDGGPLGPAHEAYGKQFLERLQERLAGEGMALHGRHFPYPGNQVIFLLEPEGLDKTSLLRHLVTRYPSTRAVITAGDNDNDPHLLPREFDGRPNYRILAGHRESLARTLEGQPRVVRRPSGDLGPGLEEHLGAIDSAARGAGGSAA